MTESPTDRASWFATEAERLIPDLYGTALRLAKNEADAQDLVSNALANAWTALASLQEPASFRGWVFRILHNCFVSQRRAARPETALESLEESGPEGFSLFDRLHQPILLWWGASPEREFLDRLLGEDLERAVDDLPEPFRVVVVLADLQGLSYQEIAEVLEIPIGTVRSRLARARSRLQRALWQHAVDAGLRRADEPERRGSDDGTE